MPEVENLLKKKYGNIVEHAGTGLKMPEKLARIVEDTAKGLPQDFGYRRMAQKAEDFEIEPGQRTDISYITTDDVDRDGEVVLPKGGDWSRYDKVVTLAHDYSALPAGINWWIRPKMKETREGLVAKTHYPTAPPDWSGAPWIPSAVLHFLQQPVPGCTGKSIGFIPLNIRTATTEEKARRPELKDKPIIDRWVGIEYAVAPVPANPAAQMEAVAKGIKDGLFDRSVAEIFAHAFDLKDMGDDAMTESMPACPKCMTNEGVSRKDDGMYACSVCKSEFASPQESQPAEGEQDQNLETKKSLEDARAKLLETTFPYVTLQQAKAAKLSAAKSLIRPMLEAEFKSMLDQAKGRV